MCSELQCFSFVFFRKRENLRFERLLATRDCETELGYFLFFSKDYNGFCFSLFLLSFFFWEKDDLKS
uniref:Uncharacterized protein n=1 Tax=Rhizophora mucronata TaxID=61149 RepID=A0A2P2PPN3_RHIMU